MGELAKQISTQCMKIKQQNISRDLQATSRFQRPELIKLMLGMKTNRTKFRVLIECGWLGAKAEDERTRQKGFKQPTALDLHRRVNSAEFKCSCN